MLDGQLAKGKALNFDPKQPKRLSIFTADSFPAWQDKCIELIAREWEATGAVDTKSLTKKIDKQDMKKAMPFIQVLKKRLDAGEKPTEVFERRLPFDEAATLKEIIPSLKQTIPKLQIVDIIAGGEGAADAEQLPPSAKAATPGNPTFHFENIAA